MKNFRLDCENFAKVGEPISKIVLGSCHEIYLEWKKRRHNFDQWVKEAMVKNKFVKK